MRIITSRIANCSAFLHGNSLPPRFLFARHHSPANLFVAGLSYDTNETVLRDAFRQHGEILQVRVICDHVTGKSKGYGFVRFTSEASAATAHNQMHGQVLDGRRIRVSYGRKVWPPNLSNNSQDIPLLTTS